MNEKMRLSLVAANLFLALFAFRMSASYGADRLQYTRDIRPILAENCFACHGPDSAARKADLRLDKREAAVTSGALTPGDPEASEVVERIFSDDPKLVMPPPSTNKVLTEEQKQQLKQGIADGAEYQKHWSFIAPISPALPCVKNAALVRNPVDTF